MNPENRFRTIGVLALAGLVSYAVLGGAPVSADAPAAPEAPAVSVEEPAPGDS